MTHTTTRTPRTASAGRIPTAAASAPAHSWARVAALVDLARFWLYRNVIALKEWHEFRATEIIPLLAPVEGRVEYRAFTEVHPGMSWE